MDRQIIYPGQIPLETDQLTQNRATMLALGKLIAAALGTGNVVSGLVVAPTTPASLNVVVSPGEIYSLQNVDNSAYSSLPADTTHTCMKQGLSLDQVTLQCTAPTTAGFSTNYLIEATFQEADGSSVVLPYYNASNPTQAFSGPGNSGNAQATLRQGKVVVQAKAGIAATTGSQLTPSVDNGYVALAVVTVANGQTTITASNIAAIASASVMTTSLLGMITANSPGRLLTTTLITSSGTFVPNPAATVRRVRMTGGGGAGGSAQVTNSSQASAAGGGAGGAYLEAIFTSGFNAPLSVTIGSGGAVNTGGGTGGAGGTTSLGSIAAAPGGPGGAVVLVASSSAYFVAGGGGNGGQGTTSGATWSITNNGQAGGIGTVSGGGAVGGYGGSGPYGTGPQTGTGTGGSIGTGYGSGGGGGSNGPSGGAVINGGAGRPGCIIIEEFA